MPEALFRAREIANSVRFSSDRQNGRNSTADFDPNSVRDFFLCNELNITREVTPKLYRSITTVLERMGIPEEYVSAFVYAAPEINATCYSGINAECIIRFSSALVEILNEDEFHFVIGHELGHFLLLHSGARLNKEDEGIEYFIKQRAKEISADRIGLIACNSLNASIKM